MTHITCRLTAKNWDQLRSHTLGNRVWATFTFLAWCIITHQYGVRYEASLKTVECCRQVPEQPVDVVDDDDDRPTVQLHVGERRLLDGVEHARESIRVVALRHRVDLHQNVHEEPEANVSKQANKNICTAQPSKSQCAAICRP